MTMNNIFDKYSAYELRQIYASPISDWPEPFKNWIRKEIAESLLDSWLENVDDNEYRDRVHEIVENMTYDYPDKSLRRWQRNVRFANIMSTYLPYPYLAAGTPVKANINGEWIVGKKLETPKRFEMLDSFSDNKTILVEIDGKELAINKDLVKVFEPLMVDDNGNKPKLEEFKKDFKILVDSLAETINLVDNINLNKINIDHNNAKIIYELTSIYPITQEHEHKYAFVEYPCWAVEQVILGEKIIIATPTNAMVAAKLFSDVISLPFLVM
jgi:hypothetical protein